MVTPLLLMASKHQRTFYGLLARRILGLPFEFRWDLPPLDSNTVAELVAKPRGERAIALLQIEEVRRAERELHNLSRTVDDTSIQGILGLAVRNNMASLALRLGQQLYPDGGGFDGAKNHARGAGARASPSADRSANDPRIQGVGIQR